MSFILYLFANNFLIVSKVVIMLDTKKKSLIYMLIIYNIYFVFRLLNKDVRVFIKLLKVNTFLKDYYILYLESS